MGPAVGGVDASRMVGTTSSGRSGDRPRIGAHRTPGATPPAGTRMGEFTFIDTMVTPR